MGGFQSGGSEGTMSSGRDASLKGGTEGVMEGTWVVQRLVIISVVERGSFFVDNK